MGIAARISTKGQLVVPKVLRERHNLTPGCTVNFEERGGVLTLSAVPDDRDDALTPDQAFALIARLVTYTGPRISDDDIREACRETAHERDEATKTRA